jgi:hypothetical protein
VCVEKLLFTSELVWYSSQNHSDSIDSMLPTSVRETYSIHDSPCWAIPSSSLIIVLVDASDILLVRKHSLVAIASLLNDLLVQFAYNYKQTNKQTNKQTKQHHKFVNTNLNNKNFSDILPGNKDSARLCQVRRDDRRIFRGRNMEQSS